MFAVERKAQPAAARGAHTPSTALADKTAPANLAWQHLVLSNGAPTIQRKCATCEEEDQKIGLLDAPSGSLDFDWTSGGEEPPPLQTKLAVAAAGDRYEQEADRIAEQVVSASPANGARARGDDGDGASGVTGRPGGTSSSSAMRELGLQRAGERLPEPTERRFSHLFGFDFGGVRIHAGADANRASAQLGALAFTVGGDVAFAAGRYSPGAPSGDRLLAHELTHVVQQHRGGLKGIQRQAAPQNCPPCITTVARTPVNAPATVGGQSVTVAGIVVEMSVEPPTPYRSDNFDGVRIFERVAVGGNCPTTGTVNNTRAFIVGAANQVPFVGTIMPAKHNIFYDNHLAAFNGSGPTCNAVRDQFYTCDGHDVSHHQITTQFTGTTAPVTTKTDVASCIPEGSGR